MSDIKYTYQWDSTATIVAIIKSVNPINTSNSIVLDTKEDILGYVYDEVTQTAYVTEKDSEGAPILTDGEPTKDLTELDKKCDLSLKIK